MISLLRSFTLVLCLLSLRLFAEPLSLKTFAGNYHGFSHTNLADGGIGEMRMQIDEHQVLVHLATAWGVVETVFNPSTFLPLKPEEVPVYVKDRGQFVAFRAPEGFPQFYFLNYSDDGVAGATPGETMLFVLNKGATEDTAPTALFSSPPGQPPSCAYMLDQMEQQVGGMISRFPQQD